MRIDPDMDREFADIASPSPEEIEAEQRVEASMRWNEIWFLLGGFGLLFGLVTWMLMIA
ncbi:hypothetical protein [Sphingobium yanoikuyae]|uniref:hypothetical protein n=1 Tax=Sphingobium yanoikuyae TaxID=13690 RepID=UPI00289E0DE5|nr:hypothetical protein [Sphingobium yanoikuyae]